MINYITAGLGAAYNHLVDRVENTPGITLDDVSNQINAFDMRQSLLAEVADVDPAPFVSSAYLSSRPVEAQFLHMIPIMMMR
jgi:hypothetical protein